MHHWWCSWVFQEQSCRGNIGNNWSPYWAVWTLLSPPGLFHLALEAWKIIVLPFFTIKIAIKDLEPFGLLKADKSIWQVQPKARHLFLSWPLWSKDLQKSAKHFEFRPQSVASAAAFMISKEHVSLHVFPTTHISPFPPYSPRIRAVKDNVVKVGILSCWQGSSNLPLFCI